MSSLRFRPVRYLEELNQLRIYYRMECILETEEAIGAMPDPGKSFSQLLERVVGAHPGSARKALQVEEPMTLVIVSDTMFQRALEPFIQWKTRKGFRIIEAYRQDPQVGSSRESIKSYLNLLYHNPPPGIAPPSYLLIVGDVEHIPLSQATGQITDLYYAEYDGEGDYIPDVFYGRISVKTEAELEAVVDKILGYEQYQMPDPTYLDRSVLIAGVDGTYAPVHGNGQIRYAGDYYLNESTGNENFSFYYPESDTSDAIILDLLSEGVGFVNYTGHGLYDRWINPTFHQNDIDSMTNFGKYPVMIGNGCETNIYNLGTCFAEALVKAPGRGALAYIGCTNDSYWDEDYYWSVGVGPIRSEPTYEETSRGFYDRVFHTHQEPREIWTPSLGEMIFGGNLSVQQSFTSLKKFYWEIYQLSGDPTLVPWFGRPVQRSVRYPAILPSGSQGVDVVGAPYDYVAISANGVLINAVHASGEGIASLSLPDTLSPGTYDLVVTGDTYQPFLGILEIGTPSMGFLEMDQYALSMESVESDRQMTPDEEVSFNLRLVNRGGAAIESDTLLLRTRS